MCVRMSVYIRDECGSACVTCCVLVRGKGLQWQEAATPTSSSGPNLELKPKIGLCMLDVVCL